jgi:hypothetical protein
VLVTTGAVPPPPEPAPALEPLVWVTTGGLLVPLEAGCCEPVDPCEPLLWVTIGALVSPPPPPELGTTAVEPLEPVVTGAAEDDEEGIGEEPVEDEPVTAPALDPAPDSG